MSYLLLSHASFCQVSLGISVCFSFNRRSRISGPVPLSSSADVLSFLEGDLYSKHADLSPIRVLGMFTSTLDAGKKMIGLYV